MMTKKEFVLEGLDCAQCAAKIAERVGKLEGVVAANMNFAAGTLKIEADHPDVDIIVDAACEIVAALEPHVVVREKQPGQGSSRNAGLAERSPKQFPFVQLAAGTSLFIVAILTDLKPQVELLLFLSSYFIIGGGVVSRAVRNIARGEVFDENFLMIVATIGAFMIRQFSEAVAVMLFYQIGEAFQDYAVNRSRRSIKAIMNIRPDFANIKMGDRLLQVDPEEVGVGDTIFVRPGERVPLDGTIVEGSSLVDTSAITGESVPRELAAGDAVLSGFINNSGLLQVVVNKKFGESTVARILDLVQNASSKKAHIENFITKFAKYYTPGVVCTAAALAIVPPLVTGEDFAGWFYRALVFLVISCPCALVISIPLGFFGGIGGASRNGILVKGGNFLEALNKVDTVVFDKTGTLTKGVFKVTSIAPGEGFDQDSLLEYAALTEFFSNHPIAKSILGSFNKGIDEERIESYEEMAGYGIKAVIEGKTVLAGNLKLMERFAVKHNNGAMAGTAVHVSVDGKYAGYLLITDELKDGSVQTIEDLRKTGVQKVYMLTGDKQAVAVQVANTLNLDGVFAELLPHEKVAKMETLYQMKGKGNLIFVGDGINDAPVLAQADVGVAMGGMGSDAAIEAADIVLMTDEPSKLVTAIKIAKRTKRIVWQNIVFSLGVKGMVLVLSAGGLATIWEAVFADVGVALIAILNAMRVMRIPKEA